MRPAPSRRLSVGALCLAACLAGTTLAVPPSAAQEKVTGRLVVFNAGSLALPFREALAAFRLRHPGVTVAQESAGSLESARKLTELDKIPDVLGVADYGVIPTFLVPAYTMWYIRFARNAMVLLYTDQSPGANEIDQANWWRVLLRPGVRVGRADPSLDPNGYRALMSFRLAERHYGQAGLAARLEAASPARFIRPKEADLTGLVQAGELDYAWSYLSIARTTGLRAVQLPPEVDLSSPELAEWYAGVSVRLPGRSLSGRDSITVRAEPIVYGLTIPTRAPNPATARAFVRFLLGPDGQAILTRSGLSVLPTPVVGGPGRPPAGVLP